MSILEEKLETIGLLCHAFHVLWLEAFGPVAGDDFDPTRHVASFIVKCEADNARVQYERFFGLLNGLEVLMGCRIDLIDQKALHEGTVTQEIPEPRKLVYAVEIPE